jgi:hypothetical protein
MAFREEDFKVATIEIWPNSGGQGGFILVFASMTKETGQSAVWLRGDFDGPGVLDPKVADRLAEAIKHAARIARGEIERGGTIDAKYRADLQRSVAGPTDLH